MMSKMTEPYIFSGYIRIPTGKDSLSTEIISNMAEPYIPCWDTEIRSEKDSSVLKLFQP